MRPDRKSRKQRLSVRGMIGGMLMGLLFAGLMAPVCLYVLSDIVVAQTGAENNVNERANFWRAVRREASGYTAVEGQETNVLIQNGGENWRSLRNGPLAVYSAWLLALVVLVTALLHLIKGKQRIQAGRSGLTIERWTLFERVVHWYVAILFIILALTGLSLLYGRQVLIPLLGKDAFSAYAEFAKMTHNYLGPFFSVGVVVMIAIWIKDNLPIKADLEWAKSAGGMWGHGHPPADKANAGEKLMFWQFVATGLALVVTGFILDFPNFGQTREVMQWSHVIHLIAAIVALVTALGHIYMAMFNVEGAMEGMLHGRVDTNWAEQHHNIWYQKLLDKGVKAEPAPDRQAAVQSQAEVRST